MKKLLIIFALITTTILSSQNSVKAQSSDGKIGELVYELNLKISSMTDFNK